MRLRKKLPEEELEFQIAPMIDVLLCLLVFFIMITSASVLRSDRSIHLPVAPNSTKKETSRAEALLNVRWSPEQKKGFVTLEEVKHENLENLTLVLAPRWKENNSYRAVIRADRACPAQYVEKVMAACAQAGVQDITFSVLNRD
jgi:biopolymer transport protein ExbD